MKKGFIRKIIVFGLSLFFVTASALSTTIAHASTVDTVVPNPIVNTVVPTNVPTDTVETVVPNPNPGTSPTTNIAPTPTIPVVPSTPATVTPSEAKRDVFSLVKPSIVYGTMKMNNGGFNKGQVVEIILDTGNGTSYKVSANGKTGWISGKSISIPKDPATNKNLLTKQEKEYYVNNKSFTSGSKYFIWVDIDRQLMNIFTGSKGNWTLLDSFPCSTGTNVTPTVRGTFTISDRGLSFGSYNSLGAKNWVRFSGSYLIHSVPYQYGKIADPTLGKRASHGCVRVSVDKSAWIYKNIPSRTTIWTN